MVFIHSFFCKPPSEQILSEMFDYILQFFFPFSPPLYEALTSNSLLANQLKSAY